MLYATRLHALELKKKWRLYVGMCTNNFSFGKLQVLLNFLVFRLSDLLQKDGILKTRERGRKHHEERRKLLRPAKNLPGLQRKRRFPL